ncbi:MAG: N-acetylmuramoyl-L-alanine amidase CwlD [Oscillospiraceae bacterium]|nr:N-acetylmuramoyl-L-alanine amidase CwlD [Oscillospiraceae bacterium]
MMGLITRYENFIASFLGFLFLIPLCFILISITQKVNLASGNSTEDSTVLTVIIDAGHGGEDGGAVGVDGTLEKNLNLDVALKVANLLKQNGVNVVLTRTSDISLHSDEAKTVREKKVSDIHNRFSMIENTKSCIFVSIHMNKFADSSCKGAQTFYSPNNEESIILASFIQNRIKNEIQKENDRKIKKSGSSIFLLYNATVPAVLVECGFISNNEELKLLKTEEYRDKMSVSIYNGIMDYLNKEE